MIPRNKHKKYNSGAKYGEEFDKAIVLQKSE
jgi:hypothetical protein